MIGALLCLLHKALYRFGGSVADACDPEAEAQEIERVVVKSYTRKRPLQDKRDALHARLRQEMGRAA